MKVPVAVAGIVLGFCLSPVAQAAADILIDNPSVRASLITYAPGEPSGEHEHLDPRFVYVLSGGTLQSTARGGSPQLTPMVTGGCMYAAPVRHALQNAGDTTLHLLEIEIKNAPWRSDNALRTCNDVPPSDGAPSAHVERTVLYAESGLIVSRIVIPPGSRDRAGSIRGPRLVFVLEGGSLASRLTNGSKAIATREAALWIDADAPLINQDTHSALTVLEITPSGNEESGER